jgi:hypothetical protein
MSKYRSYGFLETQNRINRRTDRRTTDASGTP